MLKFTVTFVRDFSISLSAGTLAIEAPMRTIFGGGLPVLICVLTAANIILAFIGCWYVLQGLEGRQLDRLCTPALEVRDDTASSTASSIATKGTEVDSDTGSDLESDSEEEYGDDCDSTTEVVERADESEDEDEDEDDLEAEFEDGFEKLDMEDWDEYEAVVGRGPLDAQAYDFVP